MCVAYGGVGDIVCFPRGAVCFSLGVRSLLLFLAASPPLAPILCGHTFCARPPLSVISTHCVTLCRDTLLFCCRRMGYWPFCFLALHFYTSFLLAFYFGSFFGV